MNTLLILGSQLVPPSYLVKHLDPKQVQVFMREDTELCTYYQFHKHKIIFFLAAMRHYAEELRAAGFTVHYEVLAGNEHYEDFLLAFLKKNKSTILYHLEIEDKFFAQRISALCSKSSVEEKIVPSPLFLTSNAQFSAYLQQYKKPFMKTFYQRQRQRLNILMTTDHKPIGGQWSYDAENRKKLPRDVIPPTPSSPKPTAIVKTVSELCDQQFATHPGKTCNFWLPVTRTDAQKWFKQFLMDRFADFGAYEDSITNQSTFVFHSVLAPLLNVGLLLPDDVLEQTLNYAKKNAVPIASLEGFVRQIIGWREFVRGIYQHYSEQQETTNFWKHHRKLSSHWYQGNTGIPPLDDALTKVIKYGYAHHIERLMIFGNLMLLLEIAPHEAHRWFMEMFVDSSDWVMGPNVYGMALFSDGGIFATKPYICGSNYYRKMSDYKAGEWCDAVDGLYWQFIEKHQDFFQKNPRLSLAVKNLQRLTPVRKRHLYQAAEKLRARLTVFNE